MPTKRTTHRSTAGKKLYAVRDKEGQFKDIQTYKKAHGQDIMRKSKAERGLKKRDTFYDLKIASPAVTPKDVKMSSIREAVRASKKK
jgi:hypothetical protein